VAFVAGLLVSRGGVAASGSEATLVIETEPAGWQVSDQGVERGVTPLTLKLPAGRRTLSLRRGSMTRQLQVALEAGGRSVHHLDLPGAPTVGDLRVETVPPGAIVAVDGIGYGTTPADVRDLAGGRHVVTLLAGDRVFNREVNVLPGALGSLVVPAAVGWLSVKAPVDVEIYEGESLVGSSRNARVMFMPGRHTLRLVNRELGVEVEKAVEVRSGASSTVAVDLPSGRVSLNATPWAEVLIDGTSIGETPIADHPVPLGPHELLFRHPTLGEQRRTVVVSLTAPVRLGVDLRK
jgi:hypothetical protein